ncbi:MAG: 5'-nucleotidase C-terminal domain-containing protein [Ilumatobacteraceae bacterium]
MSLCAAAAVVAGTIGTQIVNAGPRPVVSIQIVTISDWHAQLDPLSVSGVGSVGGAAVLSSYFEAERVENPNTLTFTAGDSFGGSPPLSGFFNEVPAVEAMNLMGFTADGLGNHNFDRGVDHLQSMVDLADFDYLAANLRNLEDNLDGVLPWKIYTVGGIKVGVVGITNPEAPSLVFPGNFGTMVPTNPIPAANKARAAMQRAGAQVTVVLTHMGVTGVDATGAATGPLIDFADAVGGFDVIVGDHTDVQYTGTHNGALVVENRSKGLTYADIDIEVDTKTGKVTAKSAAFVTPLASAVTPDPAVVALLVPYRALLSTVFDVKIGYAAGRFPRGGNVERSGEVAIGNLIADSLRLTYGTDIALTNAGGIRAPIPSSYVPVAVGLDRTDPAPYDVLVGDVYTVLPFGNTAVTRSVTGAQLWAALENGVSQINPVTCNGADGRFPQISGFSFSFSCTAAPGSRVVAVTLADSTPVLNSAAVSLTMATNDFVNAGGDFYTEFRDGQGVTREVMADVLLDYIEGLGTITPVIEGRITKLP